MDNTTEVKIVRIEPHPTRTPQRIRDPFSPFGYGRVLVAEDGTRYDSVKRHRLLRDAKRGYAALPMDVDNVRAKINARGQVEMVIEGWTLGARGLTPTPA